jgi:hypothetical protein
VVLSNPNLRAEHDSSNQDLREVHTNPFAYLRKEFARTSGGTIITEDTAPTTYKATLRKSLAAQRKLFNVDEFGRFKGGLPVKNNVSWRKGNTGDAGEYQASTEANAVLDRKYKGGQGGDVEQHISPEESEAYSNYKFLHKDHDTKPWIWFKAEVDYEWVTFVRSSHSWINIRRAFSLIFVACLVTSLTFKSQKANFELFLK